MGFILVTVVFLERGGLEAVPLEVGNEAISLSTVKVQRGRQPRESASLYISFHNI